MPGKKEKKTKKGEGPQSVKSRTNAAYAAVIAEVTKLTADEVNRMCPTHAEKDRLVRVLTIANSRAKGPQKVETLIDEIDALADVILKLVRRCV
jgi:hypothetical protein